MTANYSVVITPLGMNVTAWRLAYLYVRSSVLILLMVSGMFVTALHVRGGLVIVCGQAAAYSLAATNRAGIRVALGVGATCYAASPCRHTLRRPATACAALRLPACCSCCLPCAAFAAASGAPAKSARCNAAMLRLLHALLSAPCNNAPPAAHA